MGIAVYEIKLKIYTLVDIPTEQLLGKEAAFIDSALGLDDQWIKYHEDNKYKLYSYDMLYPIEKDGGYLKDHIYTFRIRTVNVELAKYFSKVLPNHYTRELKGLVAENRILPKKTISEIYTLTLNEKYAPIKVSENDRLDIFGIVLGKSDASAITGHCR